MVDTDAGVDDAVAIVMACRDMHNLDSAPASPAKSDNAIPGTDDTFAGNNGLSHSAAPKSGKYTLKLLMTSHGNTSEEKVHVNCQKILWATALPYAVPLARGAVRPLVQPIIDAAYFHGQDGLGDICGAAIGYSDVAEVEADGENDVPMAASHPVLNAAQVALWQLLQQADAAYKQALVAYGKYAENAEAQGTEPHLPQPVPVPVTLVTLGPLTNLAGLLQWVSLPENISQAHLLGLLSKIVVMGGSANGKGNVTRTAEFNVMGDAEAAQLVFAYAWEAAIYRPVNENNESLADAAHAFAMRAPRVLVVSWDLCKEHPLPFPFFDGILRVDHKRDLVPPAAHAHGEDCSSCAEYHKTLSSDGLSRLELFLRSVCWSPFVKQREVFGAADNKRGGEGAVICDCLAVAIAMDDSLIAESIPVHVDVELLGSLTRGQTVVDFGHCYDGVTRVRNVEWVTKVYLEGYEASWRRMMGGTTI